MLDAMPEGTVFFAQEPVIRITAPLPQAQLVESFMRGGRRLAPPAPLTEIRERVVTALRHLPAMLRELQSSAPYAVEISNSLQALVRFPQS